MMSMMSPGASFFCLSMIFSENRYPLFPDHALSNPGLTLKLSERLEQGVIEGGGVLDLRNMAEARQQCKACLRDQRLQVARLIDRGDRILVAPEDRRGRLEPRIGAAIRTRSATIGAGEIICPIGDIRGAVAQAGRPLQNLDILRQRAFLFRG